MVAGTGIWAFISPRRGVSGAHFGGLRILRTLCRIAVADGPGRPQFIARRFHTPIENAIYLGGTSATRPMGGRHAAWVGASSVLPSPPDPGRRETHAHRKPVPADPSPAAAAGSAIRLAASETNFSGDLRAPSPPSGGPRSEWPRLSFLGLVRSGSRSDSFRGPGRAECTEMHYSPGNLTRKGAGLPLLLLLFTLASRPLLRYPGGRAPA